MTVSAEKRTEVGAALRVNSNARQVARQTGVSVSTAWRIAKKEDIELTDGNAAKGPPRRPAGARAESAAANLRRALERAWKAKDRARVAALFANANAKVLLPKVLDEIRREKAHRAAAGGSSPSLDG
jgi:hypothetical protein